MAIFEWVSARVFDAVHRNNLVYNTCWEDPRLDRVALQLGPQDRVLVITSAGCNALDYALCEPAHVHAVDMNPRQNALLELKQAGIRKLEYEDFYALFGDGRRPGARALYESTLREALSPWARKYWDRKIGFFGSKRRSFYYRGTSGAFARAVRVYFEKVLKVRRWIDAMLDAQSLEEQRSIYYGHLQKKIWSRPIRFAMKRDATLSMVGVPKAQRRQIDLQYDGGVLKFVQDCVEAVFTQLPVSDNYFWRVYMTGRYTPACCPEYLKPENFQRLKAGLVDRVTTHTASVQGFLDQHEGTISRFVLLDHMDWMAGKHFPLLEAEWQAIVRRAAPGARLIWRSGGLRTEFVDRVQVQVNGAARSVGELLAYHRALAEELHQKDRVHTYGSFYIADLAA